MSLALVLTTWEAHCPQMNGFKKKKKKIGITFPKAGHSWRPFYFLTAFPFLFSLLTLVLHCFSFSDSVKEPDIHTLTRWLFWDISLPSSQSAIFPNKVVFLTSAVHLSSSLACHAASRAILDLVTNWLLAYIIQWLFSIVFSTGIHRSWGPMRIKTKCHYILFEDLNMKTLLTGCRW